MSENVTGPSLGISGEPVVRKRGRPKMVSISDDEVAEVKRQKIYTWPHASSIGIPEGGKTLPSEYDRMVERNTVEINNNHVYLQEKLKQRRLRNLAVMNSKRNAIPPVGRIEESPASRNNDPTSTTGKEIFEEAMRRGAAWEAVIQVHGICTPAEGEAAGFPGEAGGQEVGAGGDADATPLCAICRLPEMNRQTRLCDGCEQSFHVRCVRLSSESANGLDDWTCPSCTISFYTSGRTPVFSRLAQQYLDQKLMERAVAVSKEVGLKGRVEKPESALQEDHQKGLDLNVPPEAHEGFDLVRSQNGLADQNFRRQPSGAVQQNEGKGMPVQFSIAIPMGVVSRSVHNQEGMDSEARKQQLPSLEINPGVKMVESNGELPESKFSSEEFVDPRGEHFLFKEREAVTAAAVNDRKVSPQMLTMGSKELDNKVAAWKESHIATDFSRFSGIGASEISGLGPVRANASRGLDPTGKFPQGMESQKLHLSNNLSRPEDTHERHVKTTFNKRSGIVDTSVGRSPSYLLNNTAQKSSVDRFVDTINVPSQIGGEELPDITFEYKTSGEKKRFTSLLIETRSRSPEKVVASFQTSTRGQFLPTMGGVSSAHVNYVDLTGEVPRELSGQQQPGCRYVDLAGVVHDSLHGHQNYSKAFLEGDAAQVSAEDQQLKKMGEDTLQQLKDFINEKYGLLLAEGWEVEVRKRKNERHLDKYFISPEKQRFRSRLEVMRHLGLSEGLKRKSELQQDLNLSEDLKRKFELQQDHPNEWSSMVQMVAKGTNAVQLPFKCGDSVIEHLGAVDGRPGFRDGLQIWPVGYRSTWHDSSTASFCISEIVDSGSSVPVFLVMRKFCPTHVNLPKEAVGATEPSYRTDLHVAGNGTGGMSKEETNSFLNRPLFSRFSGLKPPISSVSDRDDRASLNALLGGLGGLTVERERREVWECSQARDLIGEFNVEGNSTAHAWKLFAEEFMRRCRRTPWVLDLLPDVCPHFKLEGLSSQRGTTKSLDSEFSVLLERLGQDRFGLSETLVQGMIEALPIADICMGYKSLEQRGPCWKEEDSVGKPARLSRFRIREKARKHRRAPGVVSEVHQTEQNGVVGHVAEDIVKEEIVAPVLRPVLPSVLPPVLPPLLPPVLPRPPPPAGQPIGRRLPPDLVGDVLQVWEFLCRFAEVIGRAQPPLLEDLEEGLICGTATVPNHVVWSDSSSTNLDEKGGRIKLEADTVAGSPGDLDVFATILGKGNGDEAGSPEALTNLPPCSQPNGLVTSKGSQQSTGNGVQEINEEDERKSATVNLHVPASPGDGIKLDKVKGEVLSDDADKTQAAKALISSGFSTAGSIHIPLMNYLLSDMQSKVCGPDEVPGENEESKPLKRGRKRVRDTVHRPMLGRDKLSESFSVNEWTWPEVARRYMISVSSLPKMGEIAEDNTEECLKVLRCIQGDGGVLCGALDGVAGMEVDAQLLAEAEKELSNGSRENEETQTPNIIGKDITYGSKANDGSDEYSNWVQLLDPIAKLPTNVGSRIRNRVRDALDAGPPDWAVEMLEESISKEVYKGNASGPTKRIVRDVLYRVRGEDPKVKKTKKHRKRVVPSPEVVIQRCRIVLRQVAAADEGRIVSTGIGTLITNFYESEGEGLLARPLDFRAIDLRLGAGAYGTLPAAFAADVRQIWKNVSAVYGSDSEEFEAIVVLSEFFERLYSKEVVIFQGGVEGTGTVGGKNTGSSGERAAQNPTAGEHPSGQDAGENVKAPWEDDSCRVCGIDDDHDNVLLCDGCDAEYHIYCLNPPLQEVPEGNWYCSSCVAVDKGFLEAPSAAEAVTEMSKAQEKQDEEEAQKGEGSGEDFPDKEQHECGGGLPENLSRRDLAMKLAETDYWHLSLADRVSLLRFLCDQALDTLKIRIHMEKTTDVAIEHQSRLRHLLAERRRHAELDDARLDYSKEAKNAFAVLQAGAAKMKRLYPEFGNNQRVSNFEHPPEQEITNEGVGIVDKEKRGLLGSEQYLPSVGAAAAALKESFQAPLNRNSGFDVMEIDSTADLPVSREGLEGSQERPIQILEDTVRPSADTRILMNDTQRGGGDHMEETARAPLALTNNAQGRLEAEVGGKVALPRGLTSPLDAEIAKALVKLMGVNIRRDLLGRDDHGRGYWALFGSTATPWLAVEVDPDCHQFKRDNDNLGNASLSCSHSLANVDKDDTCRNPLDESHHNDECAVGSEDAEEAQKKSEDEHRWFVYSNYEVLDRLIGWLSPSSTQEKALKTSLLQWRCFLLVHRGGVEGEQVEGPLTDLVSEPDQGVSKKTRQASTVPSLRATKLLEWKYGPFGNSTLSKKALPLGPPKRGRKKKTQLMAELSRCKCLEPVWVSKWHCTLCHVTFYSAMDLELHSKGGGCTSGGEISAEQEAGKKTGKKGRQAGKGGLSNKAPEVIAFPPNASIMPVMVSNSNQDCANGIGLIKDQGPTFAPGLSVSPSFDPSLSILDPFGDWSLSLDEGASGDGQQFLDTLPVEGTSFMGQEGADDLNMPPWSLIECSEDLPEILDGATEINTSEDLPQILDGAAEMNTLLLMPQDPLGVSKSEGQDQQNVEELHSLGPGTQQIVGNLGLSLPGKTKPGGRLFQVTGKQLVISEASLLPLEDKDIDLLEQLKMHMLDIEAVLSSDMLELGRATSSRRQAWCSLVKSANSIYKMVQATILLEQMVCADFLRSSWGYWSSFSAAAKTATISSLFLRVYALDAAILYENAEGYTGPEINLIQAKRRKRENARVERKRVVRH